MQLNIADRSLDFTRVELVILERNIVDVFARMNRRTLAEMIAKRRYAHLAREVFARYPEYLSEEVGRFLYRLKSEGQDFCRRFLNTYGDGDYCTFESNDLLMNSRGIYLYKRGNDIMYVGRRRDPFKKRINQGYGVIHPRNCYLDGQATNCHLNSLVAEDPDAVSLHVTLLEAAPEIVEIEKCLIFQERPPWNIALAGANVIRKVTASL